MQDRHPSYEKDGELSQLKGKARRQGGGGMSAGQERGTAGLTICVACTTLETFCTLKECADLL